MITRLKLAAPVVILGLLTLIFFWKILLTNLILVGVDVFLYFYPYKAYATQALLSGRLPLWNPHLFMGVPFLANSQVGLLYPLNWLFLWVTPPKQVAYSIGLHIWLAGVGAYLFARHSLGLDKITSLFGGIVFAFSGFLGAQVEHLNQLQVSAWLPWLFFLFDQTVPKRTLDTSLTWQTLKGRLTYLWFGHRYIVLLGLVISLMLLAGHTQSVYISLFGLGLYGVFRQSVRWRSPQKIIKTLIITSLEFIPLILAMLLAILLSAAQLLPTLELARQSIRSEGLTYFETVAFSLNPLKSWLTILPPYGVDLEAKLGPAFSEFVAYVGLVPLILAILGGFTLWRNRKAKGWGLGVMGAAGLFLAFGVFTGPVYLLLYLVVPGFNLFRVPARWLLLYTFAIAMLAAMGFEQLRERPWRWLVLGLVPIDLFLAAQGLRYNHPTAPEAYSSLRPAIVQLKTAQTPTDRFLSLSGIEYDPGDLKEIYHIFADQLSERAIYDYVVATKEKEVLFFNLPLVYGLNAVDGYDGGLLPLKRFMAWQRLFLGEENLSTDGRLRENLRQVPSGRLLSLFRVRHIITDKVHDVWLDNIFYDLQFPAYLSPDTTSEIWTTDIPPFAASAIGVVFHTPKKEGRVAQLVVRHTSGIEDRFDLRAGAGEPWENAEFGIDYNVIFDNLSGDSIEAIGLIAEAEVVVRGISLIQPANTTSRSVILSTEGNYRMIHGGDVKIYENLEVLPPAFIVHQTDIVPDVDTAIARLRDPAFDVSTTMVRMAHNGESTAMITLGQVDPEDRVKLIDYTPERIELATNTKSAGWLVLMDTYYPGWQAWIDEAQTEIMEVNIMFRAVELPAGKHKLILVYRPQPFYRGALLSGECLLIAALLLIIKPKRN
jgi:hypothetical protein